MLPDSDEERHEMSLATALSLATMAAVHSGISWCNAMPLVLVGILLHVTVLRTRRMARTRLSS